MKHKSLSTHPSRAMLIDILTGARYFEIRVQGSFQNFRDELENKKYVVYRNRMQITLHSMWIVTRPGIPLVTAIGIADGQVFIDRIHVQFRIAFGLKYMLVVYCSFLFAIATTLGAIASMNSPEGWAVGLFCMFGIIAGAWQHATQIFAQRKNLQGWIVSVPSVIHT